MLGDLKFLGKRPYCWKKKFKVYLQLVKGFISTIILCKFSELSRDRTGMSNFLFKRARFANRASKPFEYNCMKND